MQWRKVGKKQKTSVIYEPVHETSNNVVCTTSSSLSISVLRYLELEANKFNDRANKLYKAALLTRCYVQHFLSTYIDSEVNHKRHFIKIPFINKGIEFNDSHSIFKDNLVISSIPNYLNNSETTIICYEYNNQLGLLHLTLIKL